MELGPKNWLFLRGLAREKRHWGDFPEKVSELFPDSKNHFLELPGVGSKIDFKVPTSIKGYSNQLREEWLYLKKENPGTWGIFAISMGGMIAMDWCARFPQDMTSLILINSSGGDLSPPHHRFSPQAFGMVLKLFFKENYQEREEAILKLTTNHFDINEEVVKKYALFSKESPIKRKSFLKQMYAASKFKVPQSIPIPLLFLASKEDHLANYKCSETLSKHLKAPLSLHPTAGHDLPLDDGTWILEEVKKFLERESKSDRSVIND